MHPPEPGLVDQQVHSRKMLSEPRRSRHTQTSQATLVQTFLLTSLLGSKACPSLEEATGEESLSYYPIEHVSSQGICSPLASSLTVYNGKMKCLAAGHLSLPTQALACNGLVKQFWMLDIIVLQPPLYLKMHHFTSTLHSCYISVRAITTRTTTTTTTTYTSLAMEVKELWQQEKVTIIPLVT